MTTKTLTVSELRNNLADSLDTLNDGDVLIVTRRGKKERAIIDLDKLEDLISANDPEYLAEIKAARNSKEYFSHDDVFEKL